MRVGRFALRLRVRTLVCRDASVDANEWRSTIVLLYSSFVLQFDRRYTLI